MELRPFISVVLCTYNGERYLAEQLTSILGQSYTNLEIIVCDDASTDGTVAMLQRFAATEPRICIYQNETRLGFNKNFERGLRLAKGAWIAIADQDDIWLPEKIETQIGSIAPDSWLVHAYNADLQSDDSSRPVFNPARRRFEGCDKRQLLLYNTITGHTVLLNKELLSTALPFPNDVYYDWWLGVVAAGKGPVLLCPQVLVLHRQHSNNASQQRTTKKAFFERHLSMLRSLLTAPGLTGKEQALLQTLIGRLQKEWPRSFSIPIFFFFLIHARSAFYYRKKSPLLFYYLKYSFQKATMKQKYWP